MCYTLSNLYGLNCFGVNLDLKKLLDQMENGLWQVLVVRQDLKMGSGKIASQCARKIIKPQ